MGRPQPKKFKRSLTWYQKKQRLAQISLIGGFTLLAILIAMALYFYQRHNLVP